MAAVSGPRSPLKWRSSEATRQASAGSDDDDEEDDEEEEEEEEARVDAGVDVVEDPCRQTPCQSPRRASPARPQLSLVFQVASALVSLCRSSRASASEPSRCHQRRSKAALSLRLAATALVASRLRARL